MAECTAVSRVVDDRSPPTRRPQVRPWHAVVGIDAATRRSGSPRAPRQRPAFGCSVLRPEVAAPRQAGRASPRVGLVREAQRSTFVVQCGPHRGVWAASSKGQTTTPAACWPPARSRELLFANSTYTARRKGAGAAFRPPLVCLRYRHYRFGPRAFGATLHLGCKMGRYGDHHRRDDRRDHRSSGGGERRHDDRRRSRSRSRGRRRGRSRSRSRSYDRRRRRDHGATTCLAH